MEDSILLRNSILYWDKLRTIIPGNWYSDVLSSELLYLEDNGIYEPIDPSKFFYSDLYNSFENEVLKRLNVYYEIIKFRDKSLNKNSINKSCSYTLQWQDFSIYESKTTYVLANKMKEKGYIKEINKDGIVMERNAAIFYMAILAKYLARYEQSKNERYSIGTTENLFFSKPYNISKLDSKSPKELCLNYILNDILPIPNMNIPLEYIIQFRKEYEFELRKFRVQIREFETQLKQCNDEYLLNEICYEYREKIALESTKISKLMDKSKMEYFMTSVKALFAVDKNYAPALSGIFAAHCFSNELGLATFGGITLILNAIKMYENHKNEILENPFSYLYFARENNIVM